MVKNMLLVIVCIIMLATAGCWMVDEIIPARIDKRSTDYANVDPNVAKGIFGYDSLAGAYRIKTEIIVTHRGMQLSLKRAIEDDNLAHGDAYGLIGASITQGEYIRDLVIGSEDQPFSILGIVASLGIGGVGLAAGRKYLHTPGDFTPEQHEAELIKAKNGTA